MRRYTTATAALGMSLASFSALAGNPDLPGQFFSDNTMLVAQVDLGAMTPDAIKASVLAIMDQKAYDEHDLGISVQDDVMPQLAQLGMMQMFTAPLMQAGADHISIVVDAPDMGGMGGDPSFYVLFPCDNEEGAQQVSGMLMGFVGMAGGDADITTSSLVDDGQHWVVLHQSGELPEGGGGGHGFASALEAVGSHAISMAFIPNAQMREMMLDGIEQEGDEDLAALAKAAVNADWFGMWVNLGEEPLIGAGAQLDNEGDADQLVHGWSMLMDELKSSAADAEEWMDEDEPGPRPTEAADMIVSALQMQQRGDRVKVSLNTGELRDITTMIMLMGGADGGNPFDAFGEMIQDAMDGF